MLLSLSILNSLNYDKKQEPEVVLYLNKLFFQESQHSQAIHTCVVNQNVVMTRNRMRVAIQSGCVPKILAL